MTAKIGPNSHFFKNILFTESYIKSRILKSTNCDKFCHFICQNKAHGGRGGSRWRAGRNDPRMFCTVIASLRRAQSNRSVSDEAIFCLISPRKEVINSTGCWTVRLSGRIREIRERQALIAYVPVISISCAGESLSVPSNPQPFWSVRLRSDPAFYPFSHLLQQIHDHVCGLSFLFCRIAYGLGDLGR
jgi:hypothetical protein